MNTDQIRDTTQQLHKRVGEKVEAVDSSLADNPVGVLRRRFEALHGIRQPFVDEAKEMAELVVPGMYEGTTNDPFGSGSRYIFGQANFNSANQSLISKGVLLLSWTMASVMLPADGDYFSRNIEQSVAAQFEDLEKQRQQASQAMGQGGDPPDFIPISLQINQEFLRDDIIIKKQIASSNHQEELARSLFHSIISGIAVFGHLTLTSAKTYTIQNSVTVFDSAHEPVEVVVADKLPLSSLPDSVRKKLIGSINDTSVGNLQPDDQFVTIYTQQIRLSNDTLRVNTEIEGLPIDELSFEIPSDAPVLIPLPFMFLNESDPYPTGWLTYNRGDCFSYENGELAVEGMISAAAACILGLPPGSRLTTEEIRKSPGLSVVPVSDNKSVIQAIVAPIAQNLQQVAARQEKKERQLMMTFGMDFAIQRPGERVTAEEIQQMAAGLQKLFGATYKQLERSFQYRHVKRQFFLAEEAKLIRPVDKKMYTLSLTAGLQTQEAQNDVSKMDQLLARDAQLAQLEQQGTGSFNKDATLQWYAQKMKLDVSAMTMTPDERAEQMGIGQLFTVIRQLGPQAPGMIAQMLAQAGQMMGGAGSPPVSK